MSNEVEGKEKAVEILSNQIIVLKRSLDDSAKENMELENVLLAVVRVENTNLIEELSTLSERQKRLVLDLN